MSQKENGGMAFPDPGRAQSVKQRELLESGMNLRDYFAGKALAAIIVHATNDHAASIPRYNFGGEISRAAYAQIAYQYADAMIAERKK